jgi:hypothetical protein
MAQILPMSVVSGSDATTLKLEVSSYARTHMIQMLLPILWQFLACHYPQGFIRFYQRAIDG